MRALDIMTTKVVTVSPATPLRAAARELARHGFSALPVVDSHDGLVGIVTEADLIANRYPIGLALVDQRQGEMPAPAETVGQVMSTPVVAVAQESDVSVVARTMLTQHRRCLPIVDGLHLVGVITRRDIVRVLSRTDSDVATDVRRHLRPLGDRTRWTVRSVDGYVEVVDESGEADDHDMAQLLAEAVPGVIRVTVTHAELARSETVQP